MATQPDYRVRFDPFLVEGNTFGRYIFFFQLTTGTPNTFESFAGCTFVADLIQDGASVIESSTANGRMGLLDASQVPALDETTDIGDNEAFFWEIDKADAEVLTPGKYTYDILVTWPDGTVRSRWYGTLTTKPKRSE